MDTASALSRIFPSLPQALIRRLADLSGMQRIGKNSLLFHEGERAHFVYGLIEGRLSLLSGPPGQETIVDFMDAGDVILIPPSLLELPYMATAKAVTELLVIMIPADDFRRMTETELPLAVAVNRVLAKHWRLLLRHLTQTKFRDADSRLTQYLLDNVGTRPGPARLVLKGTKQDLAAHLGVTPATLSRSLGRLRRVGVKTSRSEIEIENVSLLGVLLRQAMHSEPK